MWHEPISPEEFCERMRTRLGLTREITLASRLIDDLRLDPLQCLEVAEAVAELDATLSNRDLEDLVTVDDAYYYYLQRREQTLGSDDDVVAC